MARVLVVDDALMMRKTIETFLIKAGHVVVGEAANGGQAVAAYQKHRPDLVTMDITMPEVDGIDALEQIIAFDPGATVVMVSALGQKHKVFEALQHGAKGYILKPFTEDKLLSIIAELLGADSNKLNGTQSDLTSRTSNEDKPLTAKMPFSVEMQKDGVRITTLREFNQSDFDDLAKTVDRILTNQPVCVTFDFTCGNALHSKAAPKYREVMASVTRLGGSLRIVCYTQDYTAYFRGLLDLSNTQVELVKKRGAL